MQLILRFEHEDGGGIYQYGPEIPYDSMRHPLPEADGGLQEWMDTHTYEERQLYFFGFDSVDQARAWFYDWKVLVTLEHCGAKLRVYAVPDWAVYVGFAQTVFRIDEAELVVEFKPTDLHDADFDGTIAALEDKLDRLGTLLRSE